MPPDTTTTAPTATPPAGPPRRRIRRAAVVDSQRISPHVQRVTVEGPDLEGFDPARDGHGGHIKLFLPNTDERTATIPTFGPNGPEVPKGASRPIVRTYTPRAFDPSANRLAVDFVLHGEGAASEWAARAEPGHEIGVAGPGRGYQPSPDATHLLLAGDETALSAIIAIAAAVPSSTVLRVLVEVPELADAQDIASSAESTVSWLARGDHQPGAMLRSAIVASTLPAAAHAWVAAEARTVRDIRRDLLDVHGCARDNVVIRGYWRAGTANHPDHDYGE
ncbi:iron-chelator utilization protein [Euzebya pacifica]|uniref:Iron-chelator utilization protein n=1 Tax=Euzebya pacifica TaxID=1608957 RepID=A0A346XSG9_9ACTN|nr:siderophore-interacting protein [Euzebya pacifica]AXV05166.1 iron-chelator utilization protein [Euzebya pacifica]